MKFGKIIEDDRSDEPKDWQREWEIVDQSLGLTLDKRKTLKKIRYHYSTYTSRRSYARAVTS